MSNGALDGLMVIDLTRVLAGPLSTMLLGDMGAEVIKVERPESGDDTRRWGPPFVGGESAYYLGVNRNKSSLTLDLSMEEGQGILRRLVPLADILIDNFKPGTLERWGLDDDWFEQHAPRVVRCSITGYGSEGPKAGMPGYDFILQAESGLMSITGEPDGVPMKLGVAIVDICTGLLATISVLAALASRESTGMGQRVEVNLHDTGLMMLANVAANYLMSGEVPGRHGNGHPNIVPYRTYRASDGDVAVAVGNDEQFRKFAALLGNPEWADDPRFCRNQDRVENRQLIDSLIEQSFVGHTRAEWIENLQRVGIPCGPINSVAEALSSSQTIASEMVTDVDHPAVGVLQMLGFPMHFGRTGSSIRSHPPSLGEQSAEILGQRLGMKSDEIDALRARKII